MGRSFPLAFTRLNADREGRRRGPCPLSCRAMPEVSPSDAEQLIAAGAQLVDVRGADEYVAGHIPGARHVPLAELQAEAAGLDREQPLLVYCRSGERSGMAADAFAASGWDAHSIEGGLLSWREEGRPIEPDGGSVAEPANLPPR